MKDEIKEILDGFKEILNNPTTTDEGCDGRIIVIDRSYDLDLDEIKLLLDYITNLQEENKVLLEKYSTIQILYNSSKLKNDKAIEHIKQNIKNDTFTEWYDGDFEELLNILQGGGK